MPSPSTVEAATKAAEKLKGALPALDSPVGMVQLGTGFTPEGLLDAELDSMSLNDLPGMPSAPSPPGHPMQITLGKCGDSQVLVVQGRRHLYEGFGMGPCIVPVWAACLCGVRNFVFLAVGRGIQDGLKPGTWVLLTDYINNLGTSPLSGHQGFVEDPFPDVSDVFSQELNSGIVNAASECGLDPRLGTAQANLGPELESPAEIAVASRNGADLVCASIVPEALAAAAMNARAAGIVLITHRAAQQKARPIRFAEVPEEARFLSPPIMRGLRLFLSDREELL